ncbi:SDR family NAD(P)-dependent oxidoreductase [Jannaschia sp. Os4]|uniref:SDR family NAD(P)-dependent oxidoreductase n=1 Tax=Jannaschia sp. Os4 TaxID=2807617 RepID=UPI00193AD0FD|nr:SDR family NAD(P)-dependent oxidoreductase [Jannaschia sp. Os4]MBM2575484.1 SDR family NAD(P)-dependent oxidoreductase [Jannaschia sp. Os4]
MELEGRRIAITGGTSGIGRRIVDRLAPRAEVVVVARPGPSADALRADHPGVEILVADLSRPAEVDAAGAALARRDDVDGLIHCAAVQRTAHVADADPATIRPEIEVNLTALCVLAGHLLPGMRRRGGFVHGVNSGLGLVPKTGSAVYCATKGGMNLYLQALENQSRGSSVQVMQAFLPLVDTSMSAGRGRAKMDPDAAAAAIVDGIERGIAAHDIGRVRILRALARIAPSAARRIMRADA